MDRPDRDHVLMRTALAFAERSTCSRNHVGVVIAREGRILTTGYNGAPAGMAHCVHDCDCGDLRYRISDPISLTHTPNCATLTPCRISVHAEANAIAYAARHGISTDGAELHTTLTPCVACAMLLINAGITRVVSMLAYRDPAGQELLRNAGIALDQTAR